MSSLPLHLCGVSLKTPMDCAVPAAEVVASSPNQNIGARSARGNTLKLAIGTQEAPDKRFDNKCGGGIDYYQDKHFPESREDRREKTPKQLLPDRLVFLYVELRYGSLVVTLVAQ